MKAKMVSCHTADSKPVKQEVNGSVIHPPLVFPDYIINGTVIHPLTTSFEVSLSAEGQKLECFKRLPSNIL
jgi:hypothetical protein